ncbi:MAG: hypothetical protein IID39_07305 [Planctomycetes bacterium]|nr:hypothetical protein [Planctomycetota bacterium]
MKVRRKVMFACICCFLGLMALEGGARTMSLITSWRSRQRAIQPASGDPSSRVKQWSSDLPLYRKHPVLHHVLTPSQTAHVTGRGIEIRVTTNKQSWREDHAIRRKPAVDTFRIFYVGDSTTGGVVEPEHSLPRIVERMLNDQFARAAIHFEVINSGTSAYSFLLYHLLIKTRILEYNPSLVVLSIDMTDVADDTLYRRTTVFDTEGEPLAVLPNVASIRHRYRITPEGVVERSAMNRMALTLIESSSLCYYIDRVLRQPDGSANRWPTAPSGFDSDANWMALQWSDETRRNVSRSMDMLTRTLRLLKKHHVRVLLTGVPHHPQYTGVWSAQPHEVLRRVAEREGVPYLNSLEALREHVAGTEASEFYWATDPTHMNQTGNRIWAQAHTSFLLDPLNDLLPAPKDRLSNLTPDGSGKSSTATGDLSGAR